MKVEKKLEGQKLTVSLKGDLDSSTAPMLDEEIKDSLKDINELVFDMKELDYISSAGIRIVLKAYQSVEKHGTVKLINLNETVSLIFKTTGFDDIIL